MNKHAIIVIKNINNEYLQYFDKRWNSYLFPNCKLDDQFDAQTIIEYISNLLKIDRTLLDCNFVKEIIHSKYSESAKKMKEYDHFIFSVEIINIPQIAKQKQFSVGDLDYIWYSYNELLDDKRIQEVNSDIVGFIRDLDL